TSVPALPATSLPDPLAYPECLGAPLTEGPGDPLAAYHPAFAALPTQEPPTGRPRRPAGLVACASPATPTVVTTPHPAAQPAATRRPLPATGGSELFRHAGVAGVAAAPAGPLRLRRRRPPTPPTQPPLWGGWEGYGGRPAGAG